MPGSYERDKRTQIVYDASRDWYVRYETYEVNGQRYYKKQTMLYYNAKSSIPIVKRKKKPRLVGTGVKIGILR